MAIYRSTALRDIQFYHSILGFVTERESAVRLSYLQKFGLSDDGIEGVAPEPETRDYIDFLLTIARGGETREILMAALPCMLSYSYIFKKVAGTPGVEGSPYLDFIRDYADDPYAQSCQWCCDFADEKCAALAPGEEELLCRLFTQDSLQELAFWNMAYPMEGER